jgi:hypothetical protein
MRAFSFGWYQDIACRVNPCHFVNVNATIWMMLARKAASISPAGLHDAKHLVFQMPARELAICCHIIGSTVAFSVSVPTAPWGSVC